VNGAKIETFELPDQFVRPLHLCSRRVIVCCFFTRERQLQSKDGD